ncbi:MAG: hypothetical protein HKO66_15610 [Saprospiraceae bacterium]|nr:thioredoxin family protein [Bacteroidia bacterium]NNL93668.1 hypothetical protein [Saprospiraceae bacterium]
MRYCKILLFLLISSFVLAQELDPVSWSYNIEQIEGDEYLLVFKAEIEPGWTVYSQFTSDDGPVPTSLNFESEGVSKVGESVEKGSKKEGFDKIFEVDVIKFLADEPFIIEQKIKIDAGVENVVGYLTYMTCDKEKCLPPSDVEFDLSLSGGSSKSDDAVADDKMKDPVKWDFSIEDNKDGTYNLIYTADIQKGWTVYSQFSSDEGPVPTYITFEDEDAVEIIGDADETGKKKQGPDPLFDNVEVIKFLGGTPFQITQKIKPKNGDDIAGYITYMACDDKGCLPPNPIDFVFNPTNLTAQAVAFEPEVNEISGTASSDVVAPDGFKLINQEIPSLRESYLSPLGDCEGGEDQSEKTLLWSFIIGFLGGLFALLTPCVFPMIPLTVSFFTKDTKRKGWVNGMIYGISIIVIYVSLGLAITAIFGDEALNRLSTNWIANTFFFLIFVVFAFSFFGYYEITLPSSWSTKSDTMADKGGFIGIFFMAFTLALVSFSCTGPIIGSALVSSASNALGPAVVMFGFSVALALPFGFFAAFPAWLNTLPQSGGWMTSVKVVLGFLELAFAFKFLSVADLTNHWGFLRYELFLGAWVIIGILTTLYMFGKIKFPHDSPIKKLSKKRIVLGTLFGLFTVYLATGFMYNETTKSYNSLSIISGFPPPAQYNYFLDELEPDAEIKAEYPSYSICANNIPCFKDYYEGLEYAEKQNKPVFLDFTGHGCVNCRKTEETIWIDDKIRDNLINKWVLVSLYVDDDKKLEEGLYSQSRLKKMRNIGNKWADFQITNFEQNSQPLYVMMTADQKVLASPRGYYSGITAYQEYMDCGLKTYNELK